jgi:hypothetical protein
LRKRLFLEERHKASSLQIVRDKIWVIYANFRGELSW